MTSLGAGSVSDNPTNQAKATFVILLFENRNEDSTVELHVRLLGEGTDSSPPTKASNIGDGLFQLDAPILISQ